MKPLLWLSVALCTVFAGVSAASADDLLIIMERAGIHSILHPDTPNLLAEVQPEEKMYLLFLTAVEFILYISGIGATVMIVIAGVRMTASAGNDGAVSAAKKMLLYSVIGLLAVFLSYFIVQNIIGIFYGGEGT